MPAAGASTSGRWGASRARSSSSPRQPGGSERLVAIEIGLVLDTLAVLEAEDMGDLEVHLHATQAPAAMGIEEHDDPVAGIDRLRDLLVEVVPLVVERREVGPDAFVAADHVAAERGQMWAPLDVRIELRHERVHVSTQAGRVDPLGGGYVSTGHPRRSQVPTPPSTTCTGCSAPCSSSSPVAT